MPPPLLRWVGVGEVGGWVDFRKVALWEVVFREVALWEAQLGVGCTGRRGEGEVGWFCVGRRWSCSRRGLGGPLEEALGWERGWEVGGWPSSGK